MDKVIDELDPETDEDRIGELELIMRELKDACIVKKERKNAKLLNIFNYLVQNCA